jgi:hypothetical protein
VLVEQGVSVLCVAAGRGRVRWRLVKKETELDFAGGAKSGSGVSKPLMIVCAAECCPWEWSVPLAVADLNEESFCIVAKRLCHVLWKVRGRCRRTFVGCTAEHEFCAVLDALKDGRFLGQKGCLCESYTTCVSCSGVKSERTVWRRLEGTHQWNDDQTGYRQQHIAFGAECIVDKGQVIKD